MQSKSFAGRQNNFNANHLQGGARHSPKHMMMNPLTGIGQADNAASSIDSELTTVEK